MKMTMTQKILAKSAGLPYVKPGQLIMAELDLVLANDITAPVAIDEFESHGFTDIYDKEKVALVMDHFTPNKDIKAAQQCRKCRIFAGKMEITNFYDVGDMGIEHALLPERGLVKPSEVIIGADSHTCTYGALGAFSTGVGSTDMAAGMATGKAWFKVPEAIKVELAGSLPEGVGGKDVILTLIGLIGVDGALYKSLEFQGEGIKSLTMDDRFTICNMAIEAGAKNGIFPVDEITIDYLKDKTGDRYEVMEADSDVVYSETIKMDLKDIVPVVALPHLPSNTKPVKEITGIKIDQVVIGSCTNGRISDMEQAASVLKGRKVHPDVRCIVIPATQKIFKECMENGYMGIFIDAGCVVSTPTCGPCLGGHMGVLAHGERCVATTNRNFVGRMGHHTSEIYLSGPLAAASSAVLGEIGFIDERSKDND